MPNSRTLINRILDNEIPAMFVEPKGTEKEREEALGIILSQWSEWSGDVILRVAIAALEDANFGTLASALEAALENDMLDDPQYDGFWTAVEQLANNYEEAK